MDFQAIPIVRIFDEQKARDFYLGFLGMTLDWEHRFEPGYPLYMQVSKGSLVLHLSEHSGDCSPGSKLFVNVSDARALLAELQTRPYAYWQPGATMAFRW